MPLRSVKMKGRIFGFHRRVWWPKCTPDSRSIFIETVAKLYLLSFSAAVFNPCGTREHDRSGPTACVIGTPGLYIALQDEAAEIVVRDEVRGPLPHVIDVHHDRRAGEVGGAEGDLFE